VNAKKFDQAVVMAEIRFAERMQKWQEKWLGDRVNYGIQQRDDELGSVLQPGLDADLSGAEAGEEAELELLEEEGWPGAA